MGQLSIPTADLIARLDYQTAQAGRILAGFNWVKTPILEGETQDTLPSIRMFIPDFKGTFKPSKHQEAQIEFNIQVAVARNSGLVELMLAVEKVVDALRIRHTDGLAYALAGTVKPFDWRTEGNFVVDGSLNAQLIITATPATKLLGSSRNP